MSFPVAAFDGAVCFTMLHHVSSEAMQNRLLAEVARVLRPGAFLRARTASTAVRFGWPCASPKGRTPAK
jgi:SAM-dependent methyltransferase